MATKKTENTENDATLALASVGFTDDEQEAVRAILDDLNKAMRDISDLEERRADAVRSVYPDFDARFAAVQAREAEIRDELKATLLARAGAGGLKFTSRGVQVTVSRSTTTYEVNPQRLDEEMLQQLRPLSVGRANLVVETLDTDVLAQLKNEQRIPDDLYRCLLETGAIELKTRMPSMTPKLVG